MRPAVRSPARPNPPGERRVAGRNVEDGLEETGVEIRRPRDSSITAGLLDVLSGDEAPRGRG